jgi:signal transduction histidine kinase
MRGAGRPTIAAPVEAPVEARVLIVDDDPVFLKVLSEAVSWRLDRRALVEACDSPVSALAAIEAHDYDVVVSDLLMGGLHGLDLLERVRARRPTSLVVLITGAADHDLSVRALRGGAYDFIQKPVDADYLVASIRRAIETRRLRAEVERQQASLRRHAEELEQTVADRTAELRLANRTKDEFLATISHELRTPLTSILGWARLLAGGRLDLEEQAMAVDSIARNARSQAQLIDDLLDVSRIITGKLRLDLQQVDLARALDGALGVVLPAAQAKGISIVPRIGEGVDAIAGDPDRLQQVLWNLLSNAVKFTPPGGRIDVGVTRREGSVEIEVADSGIGIDPEFLPFVFDRFRQGEWQHSSRRGLGLGLAIARHLVELHGGTVTAASAGPGAGATFTVVLPCAARDLAATSPRRARRSSSDRVGREAQDQCLRAVRVLVVDDEADTRQVLRLTLEKAGAVVETAATAGDARAAFRRARPDVLLCDIGLGREDDGYALLRELRELPGDRRGDVPAIALTGYAKPEDRERALDAGFQLHLAKPGPANLAAVVAGLVQRAEPE